MATSAEKLSRLDLTIAPKEWKVSSAALPNSPISSYRSSCGDGSPELTTSNLRYLRNDQMVQDLVSFAKSFKAPWQPDLSTAAKDVPWVLVGQGSGDALADFVKATSPGTYWAYYSSSAELQAIDSYPEYYYPIQKYMPQNCSKDISLVVDYIDGILAKGNPTDILNLKKKFMLQDVTHNVDFMSATSLALYSWDYQDHTTGYSPFFQFCDYIENAINATGPFKAAEVRVQKALQGYANWFTTVYLPDSCSAYGYAKFNSTYDTNCYDSYNPKNPIYTDTSVGNFFDSQDKPSGSGATNPLGGIRSQLLEAVLPLCHD